jgi:hypothetical protein
VQLRYFREIRPPSGRLSAMRGVYEKLQVHSKSEAVSKALRGRIIR